MRFIIFITAIFISFNAYSKPLGVYERPDVYWMQSSNEFANITSALYSLATTRLDENIADKTISAYIPQNKRDDFQELPSAIILDIDETVLDNSAYAAYMHLKLGGIFDLEKWNDFVQTATSTAIPGAVEFINYALKKNVKVFFVSNREQRQHKATVKNLQDVGIKFKGLSKATMLIGGQKDWGYDKSSRYDEIAKDHRIIMILGDNLTDFIPSIKGLSFAEYKKLNKKYKSYIGKSWIFLPNASYGSWQKIPDIQDQVRIFKNK